MGKILVIDLSRGTTETISVKPSVFEKLVGGSALGSWLLYNNMDPSVDPLSAENVLAFMTGPLTGTLAPCTGRHVVCSKSPLTGFWGEAHAGGHFGANLKFSGFDGVLIKGRAESPVYLHITDGSASLESADHLWGKLTDETQTILKGELGRARVACIGPAGEKLVRFASVINGERAAARCGLGAVMGSKLLKAIAVEGSQTVPISRKDEFTRLARESSKDLARRMEGLRKDGTAFYVDIGLMFHDMPIRYFQGIEFDGEKVNAKTLTKYLTGKRACYSCPIACGRKISAPGLSISNEAGPEYQTIASFGTGLLIDDMEAIIELNRICNQLGMDTISCGSTIAFAAYLTEVGVHDFRIEWGDAERVIDLVQAISTRKSIGDELAEGTLRLARNYGAERYAIHVKGLEVPNHDPRAFAGMAAVYAMASRGASHLEGDMYSVDLGIEVPELGILSSDRLSNSGKGETAARAQDYRAFYDAIMMCHFAEFSPTVLVNLLNYTLDTSYKIEDILKIGARSVTMKRLFNLRCGLVPADDRLPAPLKKPLPDEATYDFVPDVEVQKKDYYEYREWDLETGQPTQGALDDLDMTYLV